LGQLKASETGYDRFQSFSDIHYDFLAAAMPMGKAGVFAIGYLGMDVTPFNSTGDSSVETVSASESALLVGWGKQWWPSLDIGMGLKFIHRKVDDVTGGGVAVDLGAILKPLPRLSTSVAFQNLGPSIDIGDKESLPSLVRFGAAWRALEGRLHRVVWTAETSYPFAAQRPIYGTGAEYWFRDLAAVRLGYVGNGGAQGVAMGVGGRIGNVQLDYAFQPYQLLGSTHRFSGLYRFDIPKKHLDKPTSSEQIKVYSVPPAFLAPVTQRISPAVTPTPVAITLPTSSIDPTPSMTEIGNSHGTQPAPTLTPVLSTTSGTTQPTSREHQ
jgi:hypothetical protein